MDPANWGGAFWTVMHTVAQSYPENPTCKDMRHYKQWFCSMRHVLPCEKCRQCFVVNVRNVGMKVRDALKNRDSFVEFMYLFHKEVNNSLGIETTISLQEVKEKYK